MNEKPNKHAWFQFYLSTAIVLMLVAGGVWWINGILESHRVNRWEEEFFRFFRETDSRECKRAEEIAFRSPSPPGDCVGLFTGAHEIAVKKTLEKYHISEDELHDILQRQQQRYNADINNNKIQAGQKSDKE